jgi:hypothetical protein
LDTGAGSGADADFSIPQEYAEKGWAQNFADKSGDDLKADVFKMLDNSQSLVGRKVEDYLHEADLRQLNNFEDIKKSLIPQLTPQYQIPENADDYALNDVFKDEQGNQVYNFSEDVVNHFQGEFKNLGLNIEQGRGLLKAFTDFEVNLFHQHTDADALEKNLLGIFNGNTDARQKCTNVMKEFMSDDDKSFFDSSVPNRIIEIMHKIVKGVTDKYNYKEGGGVNPGSKGAALSAADKDKLYEETYNKLQELGNRPYTTEEKDALIKKLVDLNR